LLSLSSSSSPQAKNGAAASKKLIHQTNLNKCFGFILTSHQTVWRAPISDDQGSHVVLLRRAPSGCGLAPNRPGRNRCSHRDESANVIGISQSQLPRRVIRAVHRHGRRHVHAGHGVFIRSSKPLIGSRRAARAVQPERSSAEVAAVVGRLSP
jgi:hypothetical protein